MCIYVSCEWNDRTANSKICFEQHRQTFTINRNVQKYALLESYAKFNTHNLHTVDDISTQSTIYSTAISALYTKCIEFLRCWRILDFKCIQSFNGMQLRYHFFPVVVVLFYFELFQNGGRFSMFMSRIILFLILCLSYEICNFQAFWCKLQGFNDFVIVFVGIAFVFFFSYFCS